EIDSCCCDDDDDDDDDDFLDGVLVNFLVTVRCSVHFIGHRILCSIISQTKKLFPSDSHQLNSFLGKKKHKKKEREREREKRIKDAKEGKENREDEADSKIWQKAKFQRRKC
ncbi:hypothetical protein PanWU01x14_225220, partial [Parasponia andersonii]